MRHWTLSAEEQTLLGNKAGPTRLRFAILLKAFLLEGRFPARREDVAGRVVIHLAPQAGVSLDAHAHDEWSERTQRCYHAEIRAHCGFRAFRAADEAPFVT